MIGIVGLKEFTTQITKLLIQNNITNIIECDNIEINDDIEILILINQSMDYVIKLNTYCRLHNIKIIVVFSNFIFVDVGESYTISEIKDTPYPIQILEIISNSLVKCILPHNLETGDYVSFTNLEGDNTHEISNSQANLELILEEKSKIFSQQHILNNKEFKIKVIDKMTFEIEKIESSFTLYNGTVCYINKPITISHKHISEVCQNIEIKNGLPIIPSLVVFEVIKLVNKKYMPINQLLILNYDNFTSFQDIHCIKNNVFPNFEKIDAIINLTYDNNLSKLIDEECFKFDKPCIHCNITDMIGNIEPIIPFITDRYTYTELELSFPVCVIKSFPNDIRHTILWATELWDALPKDYNAIDIFNENYYTNIIQLLETFPPDVNYWTKGKRCPKPIKFDNDNPLHNDFVTLLLENNKNKWINIASIIRAENYGIYVFNKKNNEYKNIMENIIYELSVLELNKLNNKYNKTIIDYTKSELMVIPISLENHNKWIKYKYSENTTLEKFKNFYENIFKTTINIIVLNTTILYANFLNIDNQDKLLKDIIIDHFGELKSNIIITLLSDDDNVELPNIIINF
jgi:hypothetical protein